MRKIVAIGGGDLRTLETLDIDTAIIGLTGKTRPRALFIPTASSDSEEYWQAFDSVYGRELGCETDVLYLLNLTPTTEELEEKVLSSDLVYVGGGNTLKMMRRWRRLGVDRILETAHDRGIVLCGLSAGDICWFKYGHSDSMSFYHPEQWDYIRVRCLGLIDALSCPHYDGETAGVKREQDFQRMVRKYGGIGIAKDNNCAIEFIGDKYRVITSQPGANAYRVYRSHRQVVTEVIERKRDLTPISDLLQR